LVKETPTASAAGLMPKVLIPRNYKLLTMRFNHFLDPSQLMIPKSLIFGQRNTLQPVLGVIVPAFNVDMWRLGSFATEKEESKATDPQHTRHVAQFNDYAQSSR